MLKDAKAFSSFSVKDLAVAKQFYGETLGVEVKETPEGLQLQLADGLNVFVYPSATNRPADYTVLNFMLPDVEACVDELNAKGVTMEQYDLPEMKTDEKGILHNESDMGPKMMAWFRDPSGNILSLMQK